MLTLKAVGLARLRAAARVPATMSALGVAEFRAQVRAWLDAHDLSPSVDGSSAGTLNGQVARLPRVRAALYDAGWDL